MAGMDIRLIGAPLQIGAGQLGCEMGPSAYRIAGLTRALEDLGHRVVDTGNVTPAPLKEFCHPNPAVHHLAETVAWTEALTEAAYRESADAVPIFLGGDHAISAGTVAGMARRVAETGRPFLYSGSMPIPIITRWRRRAAAICTVHPSPISAGVTGLPVISAALHAVPEDNIGMIGIRSVDPAERAALERAASPFTTCVR